MLVAKSMHVFIAFLLTTRGMLGRLKNRGWNTNRYFGDRSEGKFETFSPGHSKGGRIEKYMDTFMWKYEKSRAESESVREKRGSRACINHVETLLESGRVWRFWISRCRTSGFRKSIDAKQTIKNRQRTHIAMVVLLNLLWDFFP